MGNRRKKGRPGARKLRSPATCKAITGIPEREARRDAFLSVVPERSSGGSGAEPIVSGFRFSRAPRRGGHPGCGFRLQGSGLIPGPSAVGSFGTEEPPDFGRSAERPHAGNPDGRGAGQGDRGVVGEPVPGRRFVSPKGAVHAGVLQGRAQRSAAWAVEHAIRQGAMPPGEERRAKRRSPC